MGRGAGARDRRANTACGRDMIVLDKHAVEKAETVVAAAAHADCVLIQRAQTGHSFAGVEDTRGCAGHGFHEARG